MRRLKVTALLIVLTMLFQIIPVSSSGYSVPAALSGENNELQVAEIGITVPVKPNEEEAVLKETGNNSYFPFPSTDDTDQFSDPNPAEAAVVATSSLGSNITWTVYNNGILEISGTGEMADISSAPWAYYSSIIVSVVIRSGVTSIGDNAFKNTPYLKNVTIPESVTSIGESAFFKCPELTSVIIPKNVTKISTDTFNACSSLTSVIIPNGVTIIEYGAFHQCAKLKSITIPAGVTGIGDGAFFGCEELTEINVDPSNSEYKSVDGVLFNKQGTVLIQYSTGNERTEYVIPSGVEEISDKAFYYSSKLEKLTLPGSVTSIGFEAFVSCPSLSEIRVDSSNNNYKDIDGVLFNKQGTVLIQYPIGNKRPRYFIPDDVTSIGHMAFAYCTEFTSMTFPEGITSICTQAFYRCTELTSAYFLGDGPAVGAGSFFVAADNFKIYYLAEKTGGSHPWTTPFWNTGDGSEKTEAFTPMILTEIKITSAPSKTVYTEGEAFDNTGMVVKAVYKDIPDEEISLDTGSGGYTLFSSGALTYGTKKITVSYTSNGVTKTAEQTVTVLPDAATVTAFGDCGENLVWKLCINGTLIISGTGEMTAWSSSSPAPWNSYNDRIKAVVINSGVTSIGSYAFYSCNNLIRVLVPSSVTSLGDYSFGFCSSLTKAYFYGNAPDISSTAFSNTPEALKLYYLAENTGGSNPWNTPTWTAKYNGADAAAYSTGIFTLEEIAYDVNEDTLLNLYDLLELMLKIGSTETKYDLDGDGDVDADDVKALIKAVLEK